MRTALDHLARHQPDIRHRKRQKIIAGIRRMSPHTRRRRSAQTVHCDIRLAQPSTPHQLMQNAANVLVALAWMQAEIVHRGAEAPQMVVQLEERTIPDTDHVVSDIGTAIAPFGDWNRRLAHRHKLSVDVGGTRGPHGSTYGRGSAPSSATARP